MNPTFGFQEKHILLLQAALLSGQDAFTAYQAWQEIADIDALSHGEARMLPLLFRNLDRLGIKDAITEKIKGMAKHTLLSNSRMLSQTLPVLHALHEHNIPFIALKGLAMHLAIYGNHSLRPMQDIDLLIPIDAIGKAIETLQFLNYRPEPGVRMNRTYFDYHHSAGFKRPKGPLIDLHAYILDICCSDGLGHPFHHRYRTVLYHQLPIRVPEPTDLLFHTIIHGVRWNPTLPIRWVADACAILEQSEIDWNLMVQYARNYRAVLPMGEGLQFLSNQFKQPIPVHVRQELARKTCSASERREYDFHQASYNGIFQSVRHHWDLYRHLGYRQDFFTFCLNYWGIESYLELPREALKKLSKKALYPFAGRISFSQKALNGDDRGKGTP